VAVPDHLIEKSDANADVLGGLGAGQSDAVVSRDEGSPRGVGLCK
jgi:hypothetical protein